MGLGIAVAVVSVMVTQPFYGVAPDVFADLFATDVVSYFHVARAVVPAMVEAGRGTIVNISTNEATMVRAGFVPDGPVARRDRRAVARDGGRSRRNGGRRVAAAAAAARRGDRDAR